MRGALRFMGELGLAGLVGCTAAAPAGRTDELPAPASAEPSAREDSPEPEDPEAAAAQAWLADYRRGEAVMRTEDPAVSYVATGTDPCVELPPTRPEGFELVVWQDPYEDMVERYEGVTGPELGCRFEWDMIWVDPPAGSCVVLDAAAADAFYAEVRALEPWTIETRPLPEVPHSVGVGALLRWPGGRCELLDVHGVAEVVERDRERFASLVALARALLELAAER